MPTCVHEARKLLTSVAFADVCSTLFATLFADVCEARNLPSSVTFADVCEARNLPTCVTPLFRLLQTAQRHTKHDKFCRGPRRTGRVQRRALLKQQASVQRPAAIHGTTHTSVNCLLLTHVWHTIYQHGRVHGRAGRAPKIYRLLPF